MKVCGIELKGNDAILVCLEKDGEEVLLNKKLSTKIKLKDSLAQEDVIAFADEITDFIIRSEFDRIAVKARATKGRFAGGSVSFKMESIIQTSSTPVDIVHGATVKSALKKSSILESDFDVKVYQKEALNLAIYLAVKGT